jgi:hypothetical protein
MIRARAQQSWPQLSKTEYGASAANRSRSASAKTTLGLLPPSSRLIFFTLPAASRMISWPVPVSPVNATLPMPAWAAMAAPAVSARPGDDVEDARGEAGLERQFGDPDGGERRVAGGLEDRGVAGRQSRAHLPAGEHEREVPRHDQAHDADRLAQREVEAGLGDGDRLAHQLVRGAAVVLHDVGHGADLPPRRGDGLAHVARLELGQLLECGRGSAARSGPGSGRGGSGSTCATRRRRPSARRRRPGRRLPAAPPLGTRAITSPVTGLTTSNVWPSGAATLLAADHHLTATHVRIWLAVVVGGRSVIGTATGYMILDPAGGFLDALYMTVDHADDRRAFREVQPLDDAGRIWTMILSLAGVGLIFGSVGIVAEYLVVEATSGRREAKRMADAVNKLSGHYILCGYGRVGLTVAANSSTPAARSWSSTSWPSRWAAPGARDSSRSKATRPKRRPCAPPASSGPRA